MVANLKRRLARLEARTADPSGLAPHTKAWLEFWIDQVYRCVVLKQPGERIIPFEVVDAIVAHAREATP